VIRFLRSRTLYLLGISGDGENRTAAIAIAAHDYLSGAQRIYDGDTEKPYLVSLAIAPGTAAYKVPFWLREGDEFIS